jgi:hypothetical protein
VVAYAAESEVGACFHNAESGAPLRVTLTELGHTQPLTPLRTDNSTKKIDVYWRPGRENLGDYHIKHHSAQHHKDMRGLILHQANILQVLRGRLKLLPLPQPPLRARTDAWTNPSAQRATQLRSVLERVYAVARQNQITTTVP